MSKDDRPLTPQAGDIIYLICTSILLIIFQLIVVSFFSSLISVDDTLTAISGFVGLIISLSVSVWYIGFHRVKKFKEQFKFFDE